jgi:transposase-like protein
MAEDQGPEEVRRWMAGRRAALIGSLIKGQTTAVEAARRHGLKVAEVEKWRDPFLRGAGNALRAHHKEEEALLEEEINPLKHKMCELTMELNILREAARRRLTTLGTSDE